MIFDFVPVALRRFDDDIHGRCFGEYRVVGLGRFLVLHLDNISFPVHQAASSRIAASMGSAAPFARAGRPRFLLLLDVPR